MENEGTQPTEIQADKPIIVDASNAPAIIAQMYQEMLMERGQNNAAMLRDVRELVEKRISAGNEQRRLGIRLQRGQRRHEL